MPRPNLKNEVPAETRRLTVTPITREIAVGDASVTALHRLLATDGQPAFLMERGRFSYLHLDPVFTFRITDGTLRVTAYGEESNRRGNPLTALQTELERFHVAEHALPAFATGAVGYFGFDCVRYMERVNLPDAPAGEDEACFMIFRETIGLDNESGTATLVVNRFEGEPFSRTEEESRLDRLATAVRASRPETLDVPDVEAEPIPDLDAKGFARSVDAVKNHIRQGDIFQCVLSKRMEFPLPTDPFTLYRVLREISPAPYRYFFQSGEEQLFGASPELLVRVDGETVETCPIAGTRPRGKTAAEDKKYAKQLLASVKEKAEHLMLVDLSRNDLGRVCRPGTVRVRDFMQVQNFSHVMHLVSLVEGKLKPEHSALSALFSAFPAGTLSGAPKIRAMEIIGRLEGQRRGAYGGAVVMFDFRGQLDSCITIRSFVAKDGKVAVQAGAGIVADSTASRELAEIGHKSRALRKALAAAKKLAETV